MEQQRTAGCLRMVLEHSSHSLPRGMVSFVVSWARNRWGITALVLEVVPGLSDCFQGAPVTPATKEHHSQAPGGGVEAALAGAGGTHDLGGLFFGHQL